MKILIVEDEAETSAYLAKGLAAISWVIPEALKGESDWRSRVALTG